MPVVTFAVEGRDNCVVLGDASYVYARTKLGSFVLSARCPHRGGPLNLAEFEPGRSRLICPWHERATSVTKAIKAGVPAVRRGNRVTAVFPDTAGTEYVLEHRPLSPALTGR
ncbi:Rieske 2Fe-2S domain-containing protein [Sphaerimonospora cavernae]|uniref:Rieske 2Fe-2S domain-containing protein n=1 Tax=Sphaerimonospora cavernae TaxID=1740611 RepID=A0ABV6TZX3_9ACTN